MVGTIARMRVLAPLLFLAGCATATAEQAPPGQPVILSAAGLGGVMGRTASVLTGSFGAPALDVREGNARKLQFSNETCVLDAYLYPPARGSEPVVTHIDARLPDGRDVDRASCVGALSLR